MFRKRQNRSDDSSEAQCVLSRHICPTTSTSQRFLQNPIMVQNKRLQSCKAQRDRSYSQGQSQGQQKSARERLMRNPAYQRLKQSSWKDAYKPSEDSKPPGPLPQHLLQNLDADSEDAKQLALAEELKAQPAKAQSSGTGTVHTVSRSNDSERPFSSPTRDSPPSAERGLSVQQSTSQAPERSKAMSSWQQGRVTRVKFSLKYHALFGQRMRLVGSLPAAGKWVLSQGVELKWTPGDQWTAILEIPSGAILEYKYVLLQSDGVNAVGWQNGNNNVLAVGHGDDDVEVFDNWESAPGASVVAAGETSTREGRLLNWASEIESLFASQRADLRKSRMELATAQDEARLAREEARQFQAELRASEAARAKAEMAVKELTISGSMLRTQLAETSRSFQKAIETTHNLLKEAQAERLRQEERMRQDAASRQPYTSFQANQSSVEQDVSLRPDRQQARADRESSGSESESEAGERAWNEARFSEATQSIAAGEDFSQSRGVQSTLSRSDEGQEWASSFSSREEDSISESHETNGASSLSPETSVPVSAESSLPQAEAPLSSSSRNGNGDSLAGDYAGLDDDILADVGSENQSPATIMIAPSLEDDIYFDGDYEDASRNGVSNEDALQSPGLIPGVNPDPEAISELDQDHEEFGVDNFNGHESDEDEYDTDDEFDEDWSLDEDPSRDDPDGLISDEYLSDLTKEHMYGKEEDYYSEDSETDVSEGIFDYGDMLESSGHLSGSDEGHTSWQQLQLSIPDEVVQGDASYDAEASAAHFNDTDLNILWEALAEQSRAAKSVWTLPPETRALFPKATHKLLNRESYKFLYEAISERAQKRTKKGRQVLVRGSTGMGKSYWLLHFLGKLAQNDITVVFESSSQPQTAFLLSREGCRKGRIEDEDMQRALEDKANFYVVDGKDPQPSTAMTVLLCSPKQASNIGLTSREIFVLPPWSFQELESALGLYPDVSRETLAKRYGQWGGSVKWCLERANDPQNETHLKDMVSRCTIEMFKASLDERRHSQVPDELVFHCSRPGQAQFAKFQVASKHISDHILAQLCKEGNEECSQFLLEHFDLASSNKPAAPIFRSLLESWTAMMFCQNCSMVAKYPNSGDLKVTSMEECPRWEFHELHEVRKQEEAGIWRPTSDTYRNIAFLRQPDDVVHMAFDNQPPELSAKIVNQCLEALHNAKNDKPVNLTCVMPANLYEIRRKMPLKGSMNNSRLQIKQRFIKIPLTTQARSIAAFF